MAGVYVTISQNVEVDLDEFDMDQIEDHLMNSLADSDKRSLGRRLLRSRDLDDDEEYRFPDDNHMDADYKRKLLIKLYKENSLEELYALTGLKFSDIC